jgi:hypothetical protein
MTDQHCEAAQTSISGDTQGRSWEHFWLGQNYQFSNQIPNQESWTRTDPGWVLNDNGYCQWQGQPPERMREVSPTGQNLALVGNAPTPTQANAATGGMTDGGFGVLVLLAAAAAGVWYWFQRGKKIDPDYSPHSDLDLSLPSFSTTPRSEPDYIELDDDDELPEGYQWADEEDGDSHPKALVGQGNQTHGIKGFEALELPGINLNSPVITPSEAVNSPGEAWPPKGMGAPCDPLQPEQEDEFDIYRKHVEQDGLNPKGNDVLKSVWGVTPGRGERYDKAKRRRDDFAKRLEYYRYEGY